MGTTVKDMPLYPIIQGIGGCWGHEKRDQYDHLVSRGIDEGDPYRNMEPFFIQYEKRMEYVRQEMVHAKRYRLRMYAYATLQYNPLK